MVHCETSLIEPTGSGPRLETAIALEILDDKVAYTCPMIAANYLGSSGDPLYKTFYTRINFFLNNKSLPKTPETRLNGKKAWYGKTIKRHRDHRCESLGKSGLQLIKILYQLDVSENSLSECSISSIFEKINRSKWWELKNCVEALENDQSDEMADTIRTLNPCQIKQLIGFLKKGAPTLKVNPSPSMANDKELPTSLPSQSKHDPQELGEVESLSHRESKPSYLEINSQVNPRMKLLWSRWLFAALIMACTAFGFKILVSSSDIFSRALEDGPDVVQHLEPMNEPEALLASVEQKVKAGNFSQALEDLDEIRQNKDSKPFHIGIAHGYLGKIYYKLGDFNTALGHNILFYETLATYPGSELQQFQALIQQARAETWLGFDSLAEEHSCEALTMYELAEYPGKERYLTIWFVTEIYLALRKNNRIRVLELSEERLSLDISSKTERAKAMSWLGFAYALNSNLELATYYTSEASAILEDLEYSVLLYFHQINWILIRRFSGQDASTYVEKIRKYLHKNYNHDLEFLLDYVMNLDLPQ